MSRTTRSKTKTTTSNSISTPSVASIAPTTTTLPTMTPELLHQLAAMTPADLTPLFDEIRYQRRVRRLARGCAPEAIDSDVASDEDDYDDAKGMERVKKGFEAQQEKERSIKSNKNTVDQEKSNAKANKITKMCH